MEAPTGGLCSQASTEESRTEDKNASETPTTTTDTSSPGTAHVGDPNRTDASQYPHRVHIAHLRGTLNRTTLNFRLYVLLCK